VSQVRFISEESLTNLGQTDKMKLTLALALSASLAVAANEPQPEEAPPKFDPNAVELDVCPQILPHLFLNAVPQGKLEVRQWTNRFL